MKLHYRETGEGKPFVILHGLFGNSDNWQTHGKRLSEYYRVIMVDLRNHGHSGWSDEFSYELMAGDLKELFDDLKLEEVILLGHSMGGKAAMLFAQKYPELLEKLIVVDMGIKSYPPHHQHILEALNTLDLSTIDNRSQAEQHLSKYIDSDGVKQFLLKNIYWIEKGKMAWRMNTPVLEREMENILSALEPKECFVQTLFIRGGLSNYILDEDIPGLEDAFPDSEFITIPDAGHWVHAEQPDAFIDAVLGFCLR
ncbi:alpha/beta fold hydrolase [Crocinitomicaceae bacterium CZZ-1]|uniref:Alpha/beta fold hydrolase n=1 Tax=Taishania pollutisoli TaxID=2766479 RepID=A0A8J6PAT8_9FLAO|nr:alpha/beta fold hydrolase [Taishania pollutisoli]MBC9811322.1 alpha/beta fold hydrolase [Taishania pollutisoli]MBX2947763.1 alpha/beta fold hydrolase [Crocinitomicaceae bacterium]NGF75104.1 alpha/beta fold hydrolase [Fluviicola sp. SGL-29]